MSIKKSYVSYCFTTQKQTRKLYDQTQHQANLCAGKKISGSGSSKRQEQEQTVQASESCLPIVGQESPEVQQDMKHQQQPVAETELRSTQNR